MWKELYISLNNLSTYCDALEREKMYYNSNYDVNLTTVMITWRRNSVIYDLFTCDIIFPI